MWLLIAQLFKYEEESIWRPRVVKDKSQCGHCIDNLNYYKLYMFHVLYWTKALILTLPGVYLLVRLLAEKTLC